MRIRGAVDGIDGPGIPSSLADRIDIRSTVELLPNEIMAIGVGLNVMAKSFETEPPVIRNKALLLFIPGSRYSVELDGDEMGATKTFLVFPVHMWRKLNPGRHARPVPCRCRGDVPLLLRDSGRNGGEA